MPFTSAEILEIRERQPRSLELNTNLNISALEQLICTITKHERCNLVKIAEGGFHRIYCAELIGGITPKAEVVVRVEFNISDFKHSRKMESEVATVRWVKSNTAIPTPSILFYDPTSTNPVGAPYMIMEKIPGKTLYRMWPDMTEAQRTKVIAQLVTLTTELLRTQFSAIGSLYPGAADEEGIALGPMMLTCNPVCFRKDLTLDCGPWSTGREYLLACLEREKNWISTHQEELVSTWAPADYDTPPNTDIVAVYTSLLEKLHERIQTINPSILGEGPNFVLRHPDFHPSNIMVREDDPSIITGVLDWECANTAPRWAVAQIPEFLQDRGDEFESRDPVERTSKARLRAQFAAAMQDVAVDVEGERVKCLAELEEAAQMITTMRSAEAADEIVSKVLEALATAGI